MSRRDRSNAKGYMMVRLTGVFVLRQWQTRDGLWRIEIVRIQDGSRVVVSTLDEAMVWLREQTATGDGTWLDER